LAVSREIKGLSVSRPESRFLQFLRRLGRDERPGDRPPNALAIQHSANSDYRKEIVGGDFEEGPRGERGVACADAKADRRRQDWRQFGGERRRPLKANAKHSSDGSLFFPKL
jgi:hypothetical protein